MRLMVTPVGSRNVVITGANEGIGYNMLTPLVDGGYRVTGFDIDGEQIQSLQEERGLRSAAPHSETTAH